LGYVICGFYVTLLEELVSLYCSVYAVVDFEQLCYGFVVFGIFFAHLLDLWLGALEGIRKFLSSS
jgi:hypothetical protein